MKNFYVLLQTLIDNGAKPNSILCFCRDLYEYKHAYYRYENEPKGLIKRKFYFDSVKRRACVKDWLVTFHLVDTYKPEDFIEQ